MPFVTSGDDGTLNGVTPVTLVPAPAAATERIVKTITISNTDTATVTVILRKVSGSGTRQIERVELEVGDTLIYNDPVVLDDVSSSITAVMTGAPATVQPDWVSTFGIRS